MATTTLFELSPGERQLRVWQVDEETVGQWKVQSNRMVQSYLLDPQDLKDYQAGKPYGYFGGMPSRKYRRALVQLMPGDWGILTINGGPWPATVYVEMGW